MIQIEACRDVLISGNKFVNGWIRTLPWETSRRVTVMNNSFDCNLPGNYPAIRFDANGLEGIIRDNVFRRERSEKAPTQEHAALHVLAAPGRRVVIEGNQIEGWAHSMHCSPKDPAGQRATCIIRSNTVSGDISLVGPRREARTLAEGNLNIDTLEPASVVGAGEE